MLKHLFLTMLVGFLISTTDAISAEMTDVEGKVVDAFSGEPIPDATVGISLGRQEVYICKSHVEPPEGKDCRGNDIPFFKPVETKTDKDGHFSYKNVPKKGMHYVATKPGYLDAVQLLNTTDKAQESEVIEPGTKNIVRKLVKSATIVGVLQDHKGVPLEGVPVYFCFASPEVQIQHCANDYTGNAPLMDREGKFQIKDIIPGKYHVGADPFIRIPIKDGPYIDSYNEYLLLGDGSKVNAANLSDKGYTPARDSSGQAVGYDSIFFPGSGEALNLLPGDTRQLTLQFKLVPLRNVSGAIHKQDDENDIFPMRAYVNAYDTSGSRRFQLGHSHSGSDIYDIWLPEGRYTLAASEEAYNDHPVDEQIVDVGKGDIQGIDFTLEKNMPVEFVITAKRMKPCKEDDFWCRDDEPENIYFRTVRPYGKENAVEAEKEDYEKPVWKVVLGSGKYDIEISTGSNVYAKTITDGTVDLTREPLVVHSSTKPKPITITLDEGAAIKGHFLKNGKRITNGYVYLLPLQWNTKGLNAQMRIDDNMFALLGNPPGNYLLFATEVDIIPDISQPEDVAVWEKKAKRVTLEAGKTLNLDLEVIDPYQ